LAAPILRAPVLRRRVMAGLSGALLLLVAGATLTLAPPRAHAIAEETTYGPFVEKLGAEVTEILKTTNVSLSQRKELFRTLFRKYFDSRKIGKIVIGRAWREMSEGQREDYKHLFYNYVAAVYAVVFTRYNGATFKIDNVQPSGPSDATVAAEIEEPGKSPLKVIFKVHAGGEEGMRIEDVQVEAVSLILTFRKEFGDVVQREGIDGVLKRMKLLQMPLSSPIAK
jgi:phospholipid transport system substrate-binding protein